MKYVEQVESQLKLLERISSTIKPSLMDISLKEDGWPIKIILHHIADAHMVYFHRIKMFLTEDKPLLTAFDQDKWSKLSDYNTDVYFSLNILNGVYNRLFAVLQGLNEADLELMAEHEEYGEITLEKALGIMLDHGDAHLGQVYDVLTNYDTDD